MKKITSNTGETIDIFVRGIRHSESAIEYSITEKGVMVPDEDAAFIEGRLGGTVSIETITAKEAVVDVAKEAAKAAKAEAEAEAAAKAAKAEAEAAAKASKAEAAAKATPVVTR